MQKYGHFIGGKRVAGTSGRFADVFTPMTGEVSGRVALADASEVDYRREGRRQGAGRVGQRQIRSVAPA